MKNGLTEISVILDRSGSMNVRKSDTIGGFNAFLDEQQKLPGECTVSLYQFDHEYEAVYEGVPVDKATRLTDTNFVPRGTTALLDAVGRTINAVGIRLATLSEEERPEKVLVVIQTDGQENASKEFDNAKIKEMIDHQRDNYQWQFIFLSADENAFVVGASMGIARGQGLWYSGDNMLGTAQAIGSYSKNFRAAAVASAGDISFTDAERKMANKGVGL